LFDACCCGYGLVDCAAFTGGCIDGGTLVEAALGDGVGAGSDGALAGGLELLLPGLLARGAGSLFLRQRAVGDGLAASGVAAAGTGAGGSAAGGGVVAGGCAAAGVCD
jgi:hypothetical protein